MITSQPTEEAKWYVMRAYKNEKKAEELLSGKNGMTYFIPKQKVIRTYQGKKVITTEPVIHSLVFVFASQKQIVNFKRYILVFSYCDNCIFNRYNNFWYNVFKITKNK